jgi:hypothetical protein
LVAIFAVGGPFLGTRSAHAATGVGNADVSADSASGWVEDAEVTSIGKAAARSREFLNWTLAIKDAGFSSNGGSTLASNSGYGALYDVWQRVRNVVIVLYIVIIIAIAFGLIFHTEWGEKSRRVLPALIVVFVLTFFSFTAEVLLIQGVDRVQDVLYSVTPANSTKRHLRAEDLLTVGFKYQDFVGYKRVGPQFEEAAANHLTLVKATTYTNYAISFLILMRIIILWGLVIFSPFILPFFIFPLTKRVATIWVREFARWLILGPFFALFLASVPYIWQKTSVDISKTYGTTQVATESGIPIQIDPTILKGSASEQTYNNIYQSGTNLLLGPPKNSSNLSPTIDSKLAGSNNLTETDSYARYIVALMMIWGAVILPFLLLRYAMIFSVEVGKNISNAWSKSSAQQYFSNISSKVAPPNPPNPSKPAPSPIGLRDITNRTKSDRPNLKQSPDSIKGIKSLPDGISLNSGEQVRNIVSRAKSIPDASDLGKIADEDRARLSLPEMLKSADSARAQVQSHADQSTEALSSNIQKATLADTVSQIRKSAVSNFAKNIATNSFGATSSITQLITAKAPSQQARALAQEAIKQISDDARESSQIAKDALKIYYPALSSSAEEASRFTALKSILKSAPQSEASKQVLGGAREIIKANYGSGEGIERLELAGITNQLSQAIQKIEKSFANSSHQHEPSFMLASQALGKMKSSLGQTTDVTNISNEQITQAFNLAKKIQDPASAPDKQESDEMEAFSQEVAKIDDGQISADFDQSVSDIIESTQLMRDGKIDSVADLKSVFQSDPELVKLQQSWEKYYLEAPVPISDTVKTRIDWVKKEFSLLEETLQNILSSDETKKAEGFKKVGELLPFILLGNFDNAQISKYLLAKLNAAEVVLDKIEQPEEDLVSVPVKSQKTEENHQHMELD